MMWNKLFGKKKTSEEVIVKAVVEQTFVMFAELQNKIDLRFIELSSQIREVQLGLVQMESKLLTKDLKDKQAYGLLHYKLHEAKNPKLDEEIKDLETSISRKKEALKDH